MSTEIAVREPDVLAAIEVDSFIERIDEAKALLQRAENVEEVKDVHAAAAAAQVYARVNASRETYLAAGEIKLWAERRAGEMRREIPRSTGRLGFDWSEAKKMRDLGLSRREVAERLGVTVSSIGGAERMNWRSTARSSADATLVSFDADFGITSRTGVSWEILSQIPEERFTRYIQDAKDSDAALTAHGIAAREGRGHVGRVEPGILRMPNGHLQIWWTKDGVRRSKTLKTDDVTKARAALVRVRGQVKEMPVKGKKSVAVVAALVHAALVMLDAIIGQLHPEVRAEITDAIYDLHKAEDRLTKALTIEGYKGRGAR